MSETIIGGVAVDIRAPLAKLEADFDAALQKAAAFEQRMTRIVGQTGGGRGARGATTLIDQEAQATKRLTDAMKEQERAANAVARAREQANAKLAQQRFQQFNQSQGIIGGRGSTPGVQSARASADVFKATFKQQEEAAASAAAKMVDEADAMAMLKLRAESLRRAIDPLRTAELARNAAIAEANTLLAANVITEAERDTAIKVANTNFAASEQHARRFTHDLNRINAASKLSSFQMTNLSFQLNDVIQGFALGQPPMQIFAQQGFQIAQILGQTQGGMAAGLRSVLSFLTPMRLLLGGVAAATLIGVGAWKSYESSVRNSAIALDSFGRRSGLSTAQLNRLNAEVARAAGVSIQQARSLTAEYLKAGGASAEALQFIGANVRDFSVTTGQKLKDAQKSLTEILAGDPGAGAKTLQQLGLISGETVDLAQRLVTLNREEEARQLLMDALPQKLQSAEESMTGFGRASAQTGRFLGNATNALGGLLDKMAEFSRGQTFNPFFPGAAVTLFDQPTPTAISPDEAAARRQQEEAQRALDRALPVVAESGTSEFRRRTEDLDGRISKLKEALALGAADATQSQEIASALAVLERARGSLLSTEEKSAALRRIDLQLARETNPVRQAELASQRALVEASGEEVSAREAAARAAAAYQAVIAQLTTPAREQTREIINQIEKLGELNAAVREGSSSLRDAQREMEIELALRPLLIAQAAAEGETKKELARIIDDLRDAYRRLNTAQDDAATVGFVDTNERAIKGQIAALHAQAAALGLSQREAAIFLKEQELLNQAFQQQIALTDEDRRAIHDLAVEYGNAADQADLLAEANRRAQEAAQFFGDEAFDAIDGVISRTKSLKQAAGDIARDLGRESLRALLLGQGPLAGQAGLPAGRGGKLGGIIGGGLNKIFGIESGDQAPIPVRVVNAGSELVGGGQLAKDIGRETSGGLAGLLGSGASAAGGGGKFASIFKFASSAAAAIFGGAFGGGGGGGGTTFGSDFTGGLDFGGFAATGARTRPGQAFVVGEKGPEVFVPDAIGTIIPNRAFLQSPRIDRSRADMDEPSIFGSSRGDRPVTVNVHGVTDVGQFFRTQRQIGREFKKAMP